jgi:peptidoglycan hydrolase-like protein with peptidoglycan-binding domain
MTHPSADTGTPLAQLHSAPPVAPHADAANTLKAAAKQGAKSAANKALHAAHIKAPHISNPFGKKKKAAATSLHPATVEDLQTILISRGARLTKDGLYGPNTASAWASLAKSKKLDATIKRVNPTVANVAAHTFDVLSVPAIP